MLPLGSHDIYSRSAWLFHLSSGQLLRIYNLVQRHYSWSNLGGNDSPALAIIILMYAFNTIFLTELKSHMSEERQIQEEHIPLWEQRILKNLPHFQNVALLLK